MCNFRISCSITTYEKITFHPITINTYWYITNSWLHRRFQKLVESVKSQDGKAAEYIDQIAKADEATLLEQQKETTPKKLFFS
jgi:negative regulator of replication initiation